MAQDRWTLPELDAELARFEGASAGTAQGLQHPHVHRPGWAVSAVAWRGLRAGGPTER
jgi:hypothetical protein